MVVGVTLVYGLTARKGVEEGRGRAKEPAQTLPRLTEEKSVKGMIHKPKSVILMHALPKLLIQEMVIGVTSESGRSAQRGVIEKGRKQGQERAPTLLRLTEEESVH